MRFIEKRSVILIRYRPPFVAWLMAQGCTAEEFSSEEAWCGYAYLVQGLDKNPAEEVHEVLQNFWDVICRKEIEYWLSKSSKNCPVQSMELFEQYFSWSYRNLLYDLGDDFIESGMEAQLN